MAEPCYTDQMRCLSPCCSAPCEPAVPCCYPIRLQYVGEPKLCDTLNMQGVDDILPPDIRKRFKYRGLNPNINKLGYPIGLLRSLVASSDKALFFDDKEMNGQRYAMCLKAFALLHILPVWEWTRSILDNLLVEGADLYAQHFHEHFSKSIEGADKEDIIFVFDETIYTKEESNIKRTFKLRGYEFEVELAEKFAPGTKDSSAEEPILDISLLNLKFALTEFFKSRRYCLLSTNNFYLLIWRSMGMYFVLDFYGRTQDKLELLRDGGYATLLGLRGLSNVYYFIARMTVFGKRDLFTLRDLKIAMIVDPSGRAQMRSFSTKRAEDFVQVTEKYAYLKSDLHLSLKEKNPLLSRCGLPIAVAAIIASKIDHAASWDEKMLNKIICYGFFVCRCCWEFCQGSRTPVDFDSFPNKLQIGQYIVSVTLISRASEGIWNCVPKYIATELSFAIQKHWENANNYLILSINDQNYALMKKQNFYYIVDPYRHRLPFLNTKSSSLRMFSSFAEFLRVLNLILLESNVTSYFSIHRVVVTDIKGVLPNECIPSSESQLCHEDVSEIQSINETICFREDYNRCLADIGQVSEDEEEESFEETDLEGLEEPEPKAEEEAGGEISGFGEGFGSDGGRRKKRRGYKNWLNMRGRRGKRRLPNKEGRRKRKKISDTGRGKKGEKNGKGKSGKRGKRERAGTTDSETEEDRRRKMATRPSRRGSRRRSSRRPSSRRRSSRGPGSRGRGSRGPGSRGRGSRGRGSRGRGSRGRGSRGRGSRGRGSRGRGSRGRGSRGRGSRGRGSRGRGSRGRGSRGRGSSGRGSSGRGSSGRGSKGRGSRGRGSRRRPSSRRSSSRRPSSGHSSKGHGSKRGSSTKRGSKDDGSRRGPKRGTIGPDGKQGHGKYGDDGFKKGHKPYDKKGMGETSDSGKDGGRDGDGDGDGENKKKIGDKFSGDKDNGMGSPEGKNDGQEKKDIDTDGEDNKLRKLRGDESDYDEKLRHGYGPEDGDNWRYGHGEGGGEGEKFNKYGEKGYDGRESDYGDESDLDENTQKKRKMLRQRGEGDVDVGECTCKPNSYPGCSAIPYNLAVCGSESGTYESICKLLRAGFRCADRILIMTPCGNFVVFRCCNLFKKMYFLYDGCTCNVERFRHLDLNCGTAGLLCFNNLHKVITYIVDTRKIRICRNKSRQKVIEEICRSYCCSQTCANSELNRIC